MICDQIVGATANQLGSKGVEEKKDCKVMRLRIVGMGTLISDDVGYPLAIERMERYT